MTVQELKAAVEKLKWLYRKPSEIIGQAAGKAATDLASASASVIRDPAQAARDVMPGFEAATGVAEAVGQTAENAARGQLADSSTIGLGTGHGVTRRFAEESAEAAGGAVDVPATTVAKAGFQGAKNLTTKVLDQLKGKTSVSRQFIEDQLKREGVKEAEKAAVQKALANHGDKVDVQKLADDVEESLLPLNRRNMGEATDVFTHDLYKQDVRYSHVALPKDVRGRVAGYSERVYESPVRTEAGEVHWSGRRDDPGPGDRLSEFRPHNYFAHTRIEDMADGKTRRVIEAQSDLMQKGRLERETDSVTYRGDKYNADKLAIMKEQLASGDPFFRGLRPTIEAVEEKLAQRSAETSRLSPYENTWHERVVREEVKQAAKDGKDVLQFPTGETAMKIEGLGQTGRFTTTTEDGGFDLLTQENLREGAIVNQDGDINLRVTADNGDGTFDAIPEDRLLEFIEENGISEHDAIVSLTDVGLLETFDISGSIDKENPIYKFYESEMGKYLRKKYKAERVTDENGVTWWQLQVPKEAANMPVEAFAAAPVVMAKGGDTDEDGD